MTDKKGISKDDEQLDRELLQTISQINESLEKLDSIKSSLPNDHWFEQMVLGHQDKMKKSLRKELAWFVLSAVFILSAVIFTLMEIPQLFLILQGAAVAVTVLYSYKGVHKQVDSR